MGILIAITHLFFFFSLSLTFDILSCVLAENIKFLLIKFPEVAKLDKLLSSIWCLVHGVDFSGTACL